MGATWAVASTPCPNFHIVDGARKACPWKEVKKAVDRRGNDAYNVYIRRLVQRMTPYFVWIYLLAHLTKQPYGGANLLCANRGSHGRASGTTKESRAQSD